MKEYIMQIYIDVNESFEILNESKTILDFLDYSFFIITDKSGKEIVNTTGGRVMDSDNTIQLCFLLEAFDQVDEDNFVKYLFDENSNYRLTNLETNEIGVYSNDDLEIVEDLIDKYGSEFICLYNRDYSQKELRINIIKLKLIRNIFLFLNLGFTLEFAMSIGQLFYQNKLIPIIASVVSYKGISGTWSNLKKNSASVEINKRLLKRKKEKE